MRALFLVAALVPALGFVPSTPSRLAVSAPLRPSQRLPTAGPRPTRGPGHSRPIGRASIKMVRNNAEADYYKDLGVPRSADEKAIKSAFRKAARTCHPDVAPDKAAEWAKISNAYGVLSDPEQKKRYDMFGEAGVQGAAGGGGGGGAQQVDLSDIFDSFFGGGGGRGGGFGGMGGAGARQRQRGPVKGDDLRFDLEIDFDRAIFGGEEKAKIRHLETCETCKGDGLKPGTKKRGCGTCGGQGVVMQVTRTPLGNFQTQAACPTCRGTGEIIDEFCPKCSGQGTNQVAKTVTLTIPCGVENGQKLRVRSEGDAGPNGGPAGDLYIFVNVKRDPRFRREGTEIYSDASVSYVDAILGSEAVVPTVDGDVTIKVPAGSQPETVLRLKGKGAPKLGSKDDRGNHYVTLKVNVPTSLSSKEKALIEELRELQK